MKDANRDVLDSYEKVKSSYRFLERADRPGNLNPIQKQVLDFCLYLTAREEVAITDYDYMMEKISRSRETVKRILDSISHVIDWKFERSAAINGRRYYNVIVLRRTSEAENILSEALRKLADRRKSTRGVAGPDMRSSVHRCAAPYIENKEKYKDNDFVIDYDYENRRSEIPRQKSRDR